MNNNGNSGKFINGFLLGALIGAGAVFLLGTKKGKEIIKKFSEEGLGNITDILEQADEFDEEDADVSNETEETKEAKSEMKYPVQVKEVPKRPLVRRFFRRSKTP